MVLFPVHFLNFHNPELRDGYFYTTQRHKAAFVKLSFCVEFERQVFDGDEIFQLSSPG